MFTGGALGGAVADKLTGADKVGQYWRVVW